MVRPIADFLKQSRALFSALDTQEVGKVDHTVCEVLSLQLADSIKSDAVDPSA